MRPAVLALVACALALFCPAGARAQDHAGLAQQRFAQGVARFDAGAFGPALEEFRASYTLFASPNSRLYIARALRELGRLPEAYLEFDLTAREAADRAATDPRFAATSEAAQSEWRELEPRIGRLVLRVPAAPSALRVWVGDAVVPPSALGVAIPVNPGRVAVRVEADGFEPALEEVDVPAGERVEREVRLHAREVSSVAPVPDPSPRPRAAARPPLWPLGIASLGVGGAALVSFVVFAVLANDAHDRLGAVCGRDTPCPESQRGTIADGRAFEAAANVSLGTAIVGLAGGAALVLLAARGASGPVHISAGLGSIAIAGTF